VAILERELGDAGFVEISEAFGDHAVVLFFCTARQRQIETQIVREFEGNAAVFGACAAEKKQLCSRFCMSSPSVSSTRVCALCAKTSSSIVRSRPSAAPRTRPVFLCSDARIPLRA
jgi:hypothetical protein